MREKLFELEGVGFAYPRRPACLEEVSFDVEAGERVAFLGVNGSGKSTLLRMMDGLCFAHRGTVRAFGTVLTEATLEEAPFGPHFRREVGFLFQDSDAQLFCPSVEEELAFGPLQTDWPEPEVVRRVDETLTLLEIEHLRKRPPHALSAGEKKKVALASLLTLAPSVLLLDEPTAGLDPRSQDGLIELLQDLHDRGVTLLCATHDLRLLPHLADRALVLGEDGRLASDAAAESVLGDREMLARVNLVHSHRHRHGRETHAHPHDHDVGPGHRHRHGEPNE